MSFLAKGILYFCGWNPISQSVIDSLFERNRTLFIYPHTSYFDFVICVLYAIAYPEVSSFFWIPVKPQLFGKNFLLDKFLFLLHMFPATPLEQRNKGFVSSVSSKILEKERAYLLLSPKGTISKKKWRSGYFYLAKGANMSIHPFGLDYRTKSVVLSSLSFDVSSFDSPTEELERSISSSFSNFGVVNPENSEVKLRYPESYSPISKITKFFLLFVFFLPIVLFFLEF
jgi:hypothetical protein